MILPEGSSSRGRSLGLGNLLHLLRSLLVSSLDDLLVLDAVLVLASLLASDLVVTLSKQDRSLHTDSSSLDHLEGLAEGSWLVEGSLDADLLSSVADVLLAASGWEEDLGLDADCSLGSLIPLDAKVGSEELDLLDALAFLVEVRASSNDMSC